MSAEALPHTIEPHPLTGLYNAKLGTWLFLASEVMLFGALFSTYVLLRVGAPEGTWPTHEETHMSVPIGTFNTLVLIISSVTMVMAWAALKMKNLAQAKLYLCATLVLASTFLVVKVSLEYAPKLHHYQVWLVGEAHPISGHIEAEHAEHIEFLPDPAHRSDEHPEVRHINRDDIVRLSSLGPWCSTYFATYWTMTGLHGLHILGGIIVIGYFVTFGAKMWHTDPERYTNRIECTGLYWHFVDLVWIFLFPTLYLL